MIYEMAYPHNVSDVSFGNISTVVKIIELECPLEFVISGAPCCQVHGTEELLEVHHTISIYVVGLEYVLRQRRVFLTFLDKNYQFHEPNKYLCDMHVLVIAKTANYYLTLWDPLLTRLLTCILY